MSCVSFGNSEESRMLKPTHQLETDDVRVEGLHVVQTIDSKGHFA
jgi:hypothetical protein